MTSGIYKVYLGEPSKVYIGQSVSIELRISQHKYMLRNSRHYNSIMQRAFNITGIFDTEILEIAEAIELDRLEELYMVKYNSLARGYNICSAGASGRGLNHSSTVYSEEQIVSTMLLCLDPKNTYSSISELTGVSINTVKHIADRDVHFWLEDKFPNECAELLSIKNNRLRKSSLRSTLTYKYTSLMSPEDMVYKITNISQFGRDHELDSNKVGEIMRGSRNSHKGWIGRPDGYRF